MKYYNSEEQNYYQQTNSQQPNSEQSYAEQDYSQTVNANPYSQQANSQQDYSYNQQADGVPYGIRYRYYGSQGYENQTYGNQTYGNPMYANQMYGQQFSTERMTRKKFIKRFSSSKTNGWTITLAVICFISSFFSIIQMMLNFEALGMFLSVALSMVDIVFYTTMGILLLVTKRWGFAVAILSYSTVFSIITFILGGGPGGILVVGAGLYTAMKLYYLGKAYKTYTMTGVLPSDLI